MSFEMTGGNPGIWKLSLAEAYGKLGRVPEALAAIAEALDLVHKTGLHHGDAELYRVKGELTLRQATPDAIAAAESAFRRAIEIAFGQGAKSFELRATASLARLLKNRAGATKRAPCSPNSTTGSSTASTPPTLRRPGA
jgi:hypothetical protein